MKAAIVLNSKGNIAKIEEEYIIAADAGYEEVIRQGKKPNIVIGDFDSSTMPNDLDVIKLQIEKDDTDGQAAIEYAKEKNIDEVIIYGVSGGRVDHELCNLSLLAKAFQYGIKASAKLPNGEILYKEIGKVSFKIEKGATFSIIAFGSDLLITNGINTKYPINNLYISHYDLGRSVSNIALEDEVSFEIKKGNCLIFKFSKNI